MTLTDARLLAVFAFPWIWSNAPTLTRQAVTLPDESAAGLEARDSLIEPLRLGVKFNVQNATGYQEARRLERFLRDNLGDEIVVSRRGDARSQNRTRFRRARGVNAVHDVDDAIRRAFFNTVPTVRYNTALCWHA